MCCVQLFLGQLVDKVLGFGISLFFELFKVVSNYCIKNKVCFVWWGVEENGFFGFCFYMQSFIIKEVDQILVYFNFDMVVKGFIGVGDVDGSLYGSVGFLGFEVIECIYNEYFQKQGIFVILVVVINGSDYVLFWQVLNKFFGFFYIGIGVE